MQNIPSDATVRGEQFRDDDITVLVMGPSGVGKSTFINNVLGRQAAKVSDGIESCTSDMSDYIMEVPSHIAAHFPLTEGRRLVLVDTPWFDHTSVSEMEILLRMAVWFVSAYHANRKVAGVVFMYEIYPPRSPRHDTANITMLQKICGPTGLTKLILATTRWDVCPEQYGPAREEMIWESIHWDHFQRAARHSKPGSLAHLEDSAQSAWKVIETILQRLDDSDGVFFALQMQIVDQGRKLDRTDAGRNVRVPLVKLIEEGTAGGSESETLKKHLEALKKEDRRTPTLSERIRNLFGEQRRLVVTARTNSLVVRASAVAEDDVAQP